MVTSTAERWLFTVRKFREIQGKSLDTFHSVFMKLIWILKRGRPDCATAISLRCTRMKHPDVEDRNKLKRLL